MAPCFSFQTQMDVVGIYPCAGAVGFHPWKNSCSNVDYICACALFNDRIWIPLYWFFKQVDVRGVTSLHTILWDTRGLNSSCLKYSKFNRFFFFCMIQGWKMNVQNKTFFIVHLMILDPWAANNFLYYFLMWLFYVGARNASQATSTHWII